MPARRRTTIRKPIQQIEVPEERTFVKPSAVSPHLSCPICQEVFVHPRRAPCGHTFCKGCIDPWIATNPVCPVDRRPISPGSMHHDFLIENIIGDYTVACPWRALGCDYIGPLHLLPTHKKSCFVNPDLLPEALRPRTAEMLARTRTEAQMATLNQLRSTVSLARSLSREPVITDQSSSNASTIDSGVENSTPDAESENSSNSPTASTSQPAALAETTEDSVIANTDDEEDHLPPALQPSLLFRLYHNLDTASRDVLCNFLGNNTIPPPSPVAKRRKRN